MLLTNVIFMLTVPVNAIVLFLALCISLSRYLPYFEEVQHYMYILLSLNNAMSRILIHHNSTRTKLTDNYLRIFLPNKMKGFVRHILSRIDSYNREECSSGDVNKNVNKLLSNAMKSWDLVLFYTHFTILHTHYDQIINTLRPIQNHLYYTDDIFKCIFLNENVWISLKFVPACNSPINNIPSLDQKMAWHRTGDKPLS